MGSLKGSAAQLRENHFEIQALSFMFNIVSSVSVTMANPAS